VKRGNERIARLRDRVSLELQRQLVRRTVRFARARQAWLRAAEDPARTRLRRLLTQVRVFPPTVSAPLDSLGVPGARIRMHVGAPWDQVAALLWTEHASRYEPPVSALVVALARRSARVAIVGANTGFYCVALGVADTTTRIDAVEPWPPAVERLRANLALNGLTDRVVVWPVAAGEREGTLPLHVPPPLGPDWPFEMSASLSPTYRRRHEATFEVPVTTIDAIRADDPTPIDLVLVDAEGYDREVLAGALRTITSDDPIIFTEVTSDEIDSMNALLAEWGFVTVELAPDGLWVRERMVRPVHVFGHVLDSATDTVCWMSAVLPASRLPDLVTAATECALPVYGIPAPAEA